MDKPKLDEYLPNLCKIGRVCSKGMRWTGRLTTRVLRRTWKPACILLVAVVILHTAATLITGALLRRELDKIRAAGEFLSSESMAAATIPAHQSVSPVYARLLRATKRLDDEGYKIGCPMPDGTADPTPDELRAARELSKHLGPLIRDVELAARLPSYQSRKNGQYGATQAPYMAGSLQRYLFVAAATAAREKRSEEALKLFRLGYCFPLMLDTTAYPWVPYRLSARAGNTLQVMSYSSQLSDEQLRRIAGFMKNPVDEKQVKKLALAERATLLETYDMLRDYGIPGAFSDFASNEGRPFLSERLTGYWQTPYFNWNEIAALRDFQKNWKLVYVPFRELVRRFGDRVRSGSSLTLPRGPFLGIARDFGSVDYERIALQRDSALAEHRANLLFIDILRYRNSHGEYPHNLRELTQFVGKSLPLDPFSGKEFRYIRKGREFVLYSVGSDLKDNRGRRNAYPYPRQWDIVRTSFPRPRTASEIKRSRIELPPTP